LSVLEGREPDNSIDLTLAGAGTISNASMSVATVSNLILMAGNDFYATDI
jgi:hypothetical protein